MAKITTYPDTEMIKIADITQLATWERSLVLPKSEEELKKLRLIIMRIKELGGSTSETSK